MKKTTRSWTKSNKRRSPSSDMLDDETQSETLYALASDIGSSSARKRSFRPPASYLDELITSPASKHGITQQCLAINARLDSFRTKYSLTEPEEFPIGTTMSSALATLQKIPKFAPHGKVGLFVRKETLEDLENSLVEVDVEAEDGSQEEPTGFPGEMTSNLALGEELTGDNVQDTLEGLDKDLLGVNSQEALKKLTAFVTKTVEENHPAGRNRVTVPGEIPAIKTTVPPKAVARAPRTVPAPSTSVPDSGDPFKFAFLSVVATYDAKCHVNLQDLHSRVRCVNFDPTWFHSALLTFPRSECRVSIFENGKFVITGVTTIKTALTAARNTLEMLSLAGFHPEISKRNFRAKNLTAMMELGVHLDITGFAEKYPGCTYMDQDTFGAVTHLPEKSPDSVHKGGMGLCFLIFATGRIIMVGGKNEKHMITTFRDKTLHMLKPFAYGWT